MYLPIKKVNGLTSVRPSRAELSEVKFFLSPVRMVVQTCRFVFWNRNVKLHLTPRSKGQRSNLKNYAYFGRKQGNKKRSWSCDRYMIYVIDLDEL